jgi:Fe-S-cluster-containing dehydrogenase component
VIPGKSLYYATSMALPGGSVEGLVVETHEGRPTKVEGNPLHPTSNGKSSAWAQASVLGLYDPDRLKDPVFTPTGETARSWDDFAAWSADHFKDIAAKQGQGLAFLADVRTGVSFPAAKANVLAKYPKATWTAYDPTGTGELAKATTAMLGKAHREVLHLEKADVIVSLDRDFLGDEWGGGGTIKNNRGFAAGRKVYSTSTPMSRLYCVESRYSVTGAKADHRWAVAPSQIPAYAVALAKAVLAGTGGNAELKAALDRIPMPRASGVDEKAVAEIAADLLKDDAGKARTGRTLVVAGPTQPAAVHALCHAINAALGNIGATVTFVPMGSDEASAGAEGLADLVSAINAGAVDTLVVIGANPVYDAPGDLKFAEAFARVKTRIVASTPMTETSQAATWRLPASHALESWGDSEAVDGTLAPVQPMIAPLFGSRSEIEILAIIAGEPKADGYELVRAAWKARAPKGVDFEKWWRRGLHDGVFEPGKKAEVDASKIASAAAALAGSLELSAGPSQNGLDVVFSVGTVGDGRFANAAWLQELPDPITKVVWDNVAMVSPAVSKKFGLEQEPATREFPRARMITLSVDGRSVTMPAWETPGLPDDTVVVNVGYGRTACGSVGDGVGFNVYPLTGVKSRRAATGVKLARAAEGERWHPVTTTQSHGSMEGRSLVRELDLATWRKYGDKRNDKPDYLGRARVVLPGSATTGLGIAEAMGELSHTPSNINAYKNPQRGTLDNTASDQRKPNGRLAFEFAKRPQWGMSIDMGLCNGCGTCTVACQAENNIPVVGKWETQKGREMHWIRVDRYFASSADETAAGEAGSVMFQPVACVHCENAPCEVVCPVNATVHGPEGLNYMVYNRCIGTRYCANNCPYKVRRFNFFQYGTNKFNGGFMGEEAADAVGGIKNPNWIPPRLREKLPEIQKLGMNPNVTVRSRGVMEKCTYCVQRINEARVQIKLKNLDHIPDGFFQAACQQACPTDAIVFGDILDKDTAYTVDPSWAGSTGQGGKRTGSLVNELRENGRSYLLLGYINTRPRTTYMAAVRNPNPRLVTDAARIKRWTDDPFEHGHHGDEKHEGGEHTMLEEGVGGFDPTRAREDGGYRLSLGVVGG